MIVEFKGAWILNWELVWNDIYRKQGEVQKDVLPTVVKAADLFGAENAAYVLDLGCGMGRHSIYLAKRGFNVTASDISEKGIEITRIKATEENLEITTVCSDMRDLPFVDNSFDAVLCIWTSGHGNLDDIKKHAEEMLRIVKPNGLIFVDYPSKRDSLYGVGTEIDKDTFINNTPGEEEIPHHYSDEDEILEIYKGHEVIIKPYRYSFKDNEDSIHYIDAHIVVCRKVN